MSATEYVPIPPQIIRPDTTGQFNLFLRHGDTFVLFNSGGRILSEAKRQELTQDSKTKLYITKDEVKSYRAYLNDNIGDVLLDESIPIEERAKAWSGTALHLGSQLFEKNLPGPALKQRYQRFERLIQNSTTFLQSPRSLKQLAKFINKGYDSYHHGISTMIYTVSLMQEFDYDEYKINACGMGALLHDVGKTSLPDTIVNKPLDELTDEEFDLLKLHPMVGARTCSHFNLPTAASNCILFHHERDDGAGYPTQALAADIPTHAKIVRLCDVYDNFTRAHNGTKALTPFEALKRMTEDEGLVNSELLKKFIELLSKAEIV